MGPDYDVPHLAALSRIVRAVRQHPGTGQRRRLTGFLAGLYNGPRFPVDLSNLRALDPELQQACLTVLAQDMQGSSEIHQWGVIDVIELNELIAEDGHYYLAQARRLGWELYHVRYGEEGHPDEGMSC